MFALYSFLLTVGLVLMLPLFWWRRDKYAAGFWQRFGYFDELKQNGKPVIWIHCVSVGETNAAVPLVGEIKKEYPDYQIVVSTVTKTGQELAQKLFAEQANLIFYFPYDWKFTVHRALQKIKPNIVIILETELWFNFIRESVRNNVRVFLVNGRISEKSASRYMKIPKLMRRVLRYVDLALMQTNADAQRLLRLGINANKVRVTGNVKYDQPAPVEKSELLDDFKKRFGFSDEKPLIVAASTHAPEEKWILESFMKIRENRKENKPRLLIAPRHPERFDEVAALIESKNLKLVRRSGANDADDISADVILLDSIGELRQIFPLAEIVFVGGSLIPHGGQNILEPAAARKAIVTGFYTANFAEIIEKFEQNEAVIRLPESSENEIIKNLNEVFDELLDDKNKRLKLAQNAFQMIEKNRGATEKTMKFLNPILKIQVRKFIVENTSNDSAKLEISV